LKKNIYRIKDFSGGIRQDIAANDLPDNACVDCEGVEVSEKSGALIRQKGWEQEKDLTGVTGTPTACFSYTVSEPSGPQEIKILVTDTPKIYAHKYWDGSAWQNGWYDIKANHTLEWETQVMGWNALSGTYKDHLVRDGVARIMMGRVATSYPLWYGHVARSYFYRYPGHPSGSGAIISDSKSNNDFLLCPAHLYPPAMRTMRGGTNYHSVCLHPTLEDPTDDELGVPRGYYYFAASWVYDGFQEGPLGTKVGWWDLSNQVGNAIIHHTSVNAKEIHLQAFVARDPDHDAYINHRWTALRIYMKYVPIVENDKPGISEWTLLAHLPIDREFDSTGKGIDPTATFVEREGTGYRGWAGTSGWDTVDADIGYAGFTLYADVYIQNDFKNVLGMTYYDSAGHTHEDAYWFPKFEKIGSAGDQILVANGGDIFRNPPGALHVNLGALGITPEHSVRYAARQGWSGLVAPDLFPPLNVVPAEAPSGSGEVKKILELDGQAVILRENSLQEITPSPSGFMRKTLTSLPAVGCESADSVRRIGNALYFADREGVQAYNGLRAGLISDPIRDKYSALTNKDELIGLYDPWLSKYIIVKRSANPEAYSYNLKTGAWIGESFALDYLYAAFMDSDDKINLITSTGLYTKMSTYDNWTTFLWESGDIDFGYPYLDKRYYDVVFYYLSEIQITYTIYVDGVSVKTGSLDISSSLTTQRIHLGAAKGKRIKIKLDKFFSGTYEVEFHEINIHYYMRKPTSLG
jgi:hypothetical protein